MIRVIGNKERKIYKYETKITIQHPLLVGAQIQGAVLLLMKIDKEILKAYNWIKTDRIEIDEQIDNAYPPIEEMVTSDERTKCYDKVNKLEAIKVKKDSEAMRLIVKYHQRLWT